MEDTYCAEHDKDATVMAKSIHGRDLVIQGWCDEDGGHEVEVVE